MKTIIKKIRVVGVLITLFALFSFSGAGGGDSFRVYFNDRLLLEQFVHMDKSVKDLELSRGSESGQVEIFYSHCGKTGTKRYLTIQDENRKPVHVLEYPDAAGGAVSMIFTVKQVMSLLKNQQDRFFVSYSSKELPKGMTLAGFSLE